jgi:hypothetical protein
MKKLLMSFILTLIIISFVPASSRAQEYRERERIDNGKKVVTSGSSNYYFDKIYLSGDYYLAMCIPKNTTIGYVYYGYVSSQSTSSAPSRNGDKYFGQTWGDAVNDKITIQPVSSLTLYEYKGKGYSMSNASIYNASGKFTYYVASEDLYNWTTITAPNTSYGYLANWSPNGEQDTSGFDTYSIGLSVSEAGLSVKSGIKLNITDDFIDGYDYSSSDLGLFKVRYDYKKYNAIGFCSSSRRNKIFNATTVNNAYEYRAVKSNLKISKPITIKACFTVVDSKSWPTEIKGYSTSLVTNLSY